MTIPKGWKKVRRGTLLRAGDKFYNRFAQGNWMETFRADELFDSKNTNTYIRRIAKKKK